MNRREFIQNTSLVTAGLALAPSMAWTAQTGFPVVRIPEAERKFKSAVVEKAIAQDQSSIGNQEIGWMFGYCFPNTLDTTVDFEVVNALLEECRRAARSAAARADRRRRQYLLEGSFGDGANNHGFNRAWWERLWLQQIQDHPIATMQNLRILLAGTVGRPALSAALALAGAFGMLGRLQGSFWQRVEAGTWCREPIRFSYLGAAIFPAPN